MDFKKLVSSVRFADFFFTDALGGIHMMEESVDNVPGHLKTGIILNL